MVERPTPQELHLSSHPSSLSLFAGASRWMNPTRIQKAKEPDDEIQVFWDVGLHRSHPQVLLKSRLLIHWRWRRVGACISTCPQVMLILLLRELHLESHGYCPGCPGRWRRVGVALKRPVEIAGMLSLVLFRGLNSICSHGYSACCAVGDQSMSPLTPGLRVRLTFLASTICFLQISRTCIRGFIRILTLPLISPPSFSIFAQAQACPDSDPGTCSLQVSLLRLTC